MKSDLPACGLFKATLQAQQQRTEREALEHERAEHHAERGDEDGEDGAAQEQRDDDLEHFHRP